MNESAKPRKLQYKNDTLSLSFHFLLEGLSIAVTNKSGEDIKIKWDELRISENGIDKKIEHVSARLFSNGAFDIYQPPPVISPESKCTDIVVYADNVYYEKKSGGEVMKIKDMYPRKGNKSTRDSIEQLKGHKIRLLFPIEFRNVSYSWVFNFLLTDIKSKKAASAGDVLGVFMTF